MKTCFVVNKCSFFYSHRFELAKKLASLGEVVLITDTKGTDASVIKNIIANNIKIRSVSKRNSRRGLFGFIMYFFRVFNAIGHTKPQAIFFVTLEISFVGVLISWFRKKHSSYFLITGLGPFFFNKTIKNQLVNCIFKIVFLTSGLSQKNKYIFQNHNDRNIFLEKKFISVNQSNIIHGNGIPIDKIYYKKRLPSNSLSFLFASRLVISKGINEFIAASKIVKNLYPEISINIAGKYDPTDPESISYNDYKEILNIDIFNFLGDIPHDDMQECYKNSDIFVLPSYSEGLPKAALEAAATGMPLILSNVSGCKDCLIEGKNGLFVKPFDEVDLANQMQNMINLSFKIDEMSKQSRLLIEEKFSLELIAKQYEKIIV